MLDTQMIKLLKSIRKSNGQISYSELCNNPLSENIIMKLRNQGYVSVRPINGYGEPLPESKVFVTPEGENYLLDQRALAFRENIRQILVPIIIGVLSYIASKLIDTWLF
ncbi:MAG: hypothetical protein HPY74_20820 [Firmicutes bacterium]|nr:hypothetical protein [Bacillota bacterium]